MSTRGHHGLLLAGAVGGFPTYLSNTATDLGAADATLHLINMPATVNVGDLLIALIAVDGNPTITTPSGWTLLNSTPATVAVVKAAVYYKVADGSEGGTTADFTTGASERMMGQVVRIAAGTYSGVPEAAGAGTSSSVNPDPPNLTPSWGALNTLWIAMSAIDNTRTVSVYPLPNNQVRTANAGAGTAYATLASCSNSLNASSLNPGAFTINVASDSASVTIGIRPA